jgi:hypothetical protein
MMMMFQREFQAGVYTCPDCGNRLAGERDLLRCEEHGAFFAYGPQLLVRAPQQDVRLPDTLLPWENEGSRRTR